MSNRHHTLFELLDPPPGGAQRLRSLLAAPHAARYPAHGRSAVSFVTLTVLVSVIYFGIARQTLPDGARDSVTRTAPADAQGLLASPALDELLERIPLEDGLRVRIDDRTVETEELPSSDPKVRIYRML